MTTAAARGGRRFILLALGSAGDVLPFVAVGQALQAQGWPVCVGSNPRVAPLVRAAGLEFMPIGSLQDVQRTETHPRLWHPVDGFGVLWRHLVVPALQPSFEWVSDEVARSANCGERLTVVGSPLALGARVARECEDFDLVSVSLAPMNMAGTDDPMFLGPWQVPRWWPGSWRAGLWQFLERRKLAPLMQERFLPWRASLGLPPLKDAVLGPWLRSPDRHQAWFPGWFAPVDSAWPGTAQFDFPLISDPQLPAALTDEEEDWLGGGPAPVVVYPGSGRTDAQAMLRTATATIRALGLRSLVVSPQSTVERGGGGDVREVQRARFDVWLPRAAAVVHHGGIGTIAQALRAGCPQLIWPSSFDQHENAWHVRQLGRGQKLSGLDRRRWRQTLQVLLNQPRMPMGRDGRDEIAQAVADRRADA